MTGGNTNSNIISATAHTFNPTTNSWSELTAMNVARHSHVSAIIEGKLYVAGGLGASGGLTSAEVYDFTSRQWTPIASLNVPRLNATSLVTRDPSGNPLWFIVGGLNLITALPLGAEVYDVRNNRWVILDKSFNLGVPRTFFDGAVAGNFFYAVGGANPTSSINAVERIRIDTLTPTMDNQPPVLVAPASVIGIAGQEIKFSVQASDIGAPTPITIDLTNPLPGSEFLSANPSASSATGEFRWTPQPTDTGKTFTLAFKAQDGQFSETKVVRVTVAEAAPLVTVNAADFRQGPVAPDAIVAAFGIGFAVRAEAASTVPLPLEMSGTKVLVNGEAAALFYVSPTQVNFVIPATTNPGTASIVIVSPAGQYSFGQVTVNLAAPAIFTRDSSGSGEAAAQATPDGVIYQSSPFDILVNGRSNVLLLFGTGIRRAPAIDPGDGNGVAESVTATIDGKPAQVSYAGAQGNFSGLDQLNIEFPTSLAGGPQRSVPVIISVNGLTANSVMITIK
jgi:adhesin/invasin